MTGFLTVVVLGSGAYWYQQRVEMKNAVHSLLATTMLYNIRDALKTNEHLEFHWRSDGYIVACGSTFTATSAYDSTLIASVTRGRVPGLCDAQNDLVNDSVQ